MGQCKSCFSPDIDLLDTQLTHFAGSATSLPPLPDEAVQAVCTCDAHCVPINFEVEPSIWSDEHDTTLKECLINISLIDLFETFREFVKDFISDDEYLKRTRTHLATVPLCCCWCDSYSETSFRVIQFGSCAGTTRFARKFIQTRPITLETPGFDTRFETNIEIGKNVIPIEVFDTNIGEFPSLTRTYLETYEPHVVILIYDVTDRESFLSIQRLYKRLYQIYETDINDEKLNLSSDRSNRSNRSSLGFEQNNSTQLPSSLSSIKSFLSGSFLSTRPRNQFLSCHSTSILSSSHSAQSRHSTQIDSSIISVASGNSLCQSNFSRTFSQMPPVILVGIHADVSIHDRSITMLEGLDLSQKWNVPYLETSSITGVNVEKVFIECVFTRWVYDTFPMSRTRSDAIVL